MDERALTVTLTRPPGGAVVVAVGGDLDQHSGPELRVCLETALREPGSGVIIDLASLTYCDSTGVSILVNAHERAAASGAPFVLAAPPPDLALMLTIFGLNEVFTVQPTIAEAMALLVR